MRRVFGGTLAATLVLGVGIALAGNEIACVEGMTCQGTTGNDILRGTPERDNIYADDFHGEGLLMLRPGAWQAETFSTKNFCPKSVPSCVTPSTLQAINPVDIPDALSQFSGSFGGPL